MKHMLVGRILLICMMLCIGCCTTLADGGYAYAIVQNPNAADRLNLRAAPSATRNRWANIITAWRFRFLKI